MIVTNYFNCIAASEDLTIWRHNIVFAGSNCGANDYLQNPGKMLAVDLTGTEPNVVEMHIMNVPADYHLIPHGLYIDNATDRLFVISHDHVTEEESIAVFKIMTYAADTPFANPNIPYLSFEYAM